MSEARERLKARIVAQLERNGATYAEFLRVVVDARPADFKSAVAELRAEGRIEPSDSPGAIRATGRVAS